MIYQLMADTCEYQCSTVEHLFSLYILKKRIYPSGGVKLLMSLPGSDDPAGLIRIAEKEGFFQEAVLFG